jgi:hypothetical protein
LKNLTSEVCTSLFWQIRGIKDDFRRATFELRYKDDKGEWQTGHSYGPNELAQLEYASKEARKRIDAWRREMRQARRSKSPWQPNPPPACAEPAAHCEGDRLQTRYLVSQRLIFGIPRYA